MKTIGDEYERVAKKYLIKQGIKVIAENVLYRVGEIDLVGQDNEGTLLFIEVKGRDNNTHGEATEFVDFRKQQKIIKATSHYCSENNLWNKSMRFDVIGITKNATTDNRKSVATNFFKKKIDLQQYTITWIKNAFDASI